MNGCAKPLDRQDMAKTVGPLTGLDTVGGLMHRTAYGR